MEVHGRSFPDIRLTFQVRKVMCGMVGMVVACRIKVSASVPVHFLWTLYFRLWTWIWDLGLDLTIFYSVLRVRNYCEMKISQFL